MSLLLSHSRYSILVNNHTYTSTYPCNFGIARTCLNPICTPHTPHVNTQDMFRSMARNCIEETTSSLQQQSATLPAARETHHIEMHHIAHYYTNDTDYTIETPSMILPLRHTARSMYRSRCPMLVVVVLVVNPDATDALPFVATCLMFRCFPCAVIFVCVCVTVTKAAAGVRAARRRAKLSEDRTHRSQLGQRGLASSPGIQVNAGAWLGSNR